MAVQTKAILFLSVALICACRMIMAVGYDETVLSLYCRRLKASPDDVCQFSNLGGGFTAVQKQAEGNRDAEVLLKVVTPAQQVLCYVVALCHHGVQDCHGCFATALEKMQGCLRFIGAQVQLKDCEIKYDKYGQFQL